MNSHLEILSLTNRFQGRTADSKDDAQDLSNTCHKLLEEARALGLNLDDVIDVVRRYSDSSENSN